MFNYTAFTTMFRTLNEEVGKFFERVKVFLFVRETSETFSIGKFFEKAI